LPESECYDFTGVSLDPVLTKRPSAGNMTVSRDNAHAVRHRSFDRNPKPIFIQGARVNEENRSARRFSCAGTFIGSSLNEAYLFKYTVRASSNFCPDERLLIRHNPDSRGSAVSRRHYGKLSGVGKHVQDEVIRAYFCKH
jgi:hypothetical protein